MDRVSLTFMHRTVAIMPSRGFQGLREIGGAWGAVADEAQARRCVAEAQICLQDLSVSVRKKDLDDNPHRLRPAHESDLKDVTMGRLTISNEEKKIMRTKLTERQACSRDEVLRLIRLDASLDSWLWACRNSHLALIGVDDTEVLAALSPAYKHISISGAHNIADGINHFLTKVHTAGMCRSLTLEDVDLSAESVPLLTSLFTRWTSESKLFTITQCENYQLDVASFLSTWFADPEPFNGSDITVSISVPCTVSVSLGDTNLHIEYIDDNSPQTVDITASDSKYQARLEKRYDVQRNFKLYIKFPAF